MGRFSSNASIVCENLPRAFYRLFYFTVLWFNTLKQHCVGKTLLSMWEIEIIVAIFPTDLVTNSLISFLTNRNRKQKSGFQQVGGLVMRKVSVFCL